MNVKEILIEFVESSEVLPDKDNVIKFLCCLDHNMKATTAIEVIKRLMEPHEKRKIPETVLRLYELEIALKSNQHGNVFWDQTWERGRDHVVHSLNVYLLGLLLNDWLGLTVNAFQWKLAALFHDIGYPIQIASNLMNKFVIQDIDGLRDQLNHQTRKKFAINVSFPSLNRLNASQSGFKLLQDCFKEWALGNHLKAEVEYRNMVRSGKVDHGIASSMMLLSYIDMYYQNANKDRDNYSYDEDHVSWGQSDFVEFVVPACAAIFLHTTKRYESILDKENASLAYLLRIADAFQDWDRPYCNRPGYTADQYTLEHVDGCIKFFCPASRVDDIKNDLKMITNSNTIEIKPLQ
jgi:hypothetical protein